jgi:hypothetical protein
VTESSFEPIRLVAKLYDALNGDDRPGEHEANPLSRIMLTRQAADAERVGYRRTSASQKSGRTRWRTRRIIQQYRRCFFPLDSKRRSTVVIAEEVDLSRRLAA